MGAVKNLLVRAGFDASGVTKGTKQMQQTMSGLQKTISSTMKGIGLTLAAAGIGKAIKDAVSSAMDVEASIQQIGRIMGANSEQFMKWANSSATAFNMSRQDALKYGAIFGNLISGFSKDTTQAMNNTEELLKASSIIASSTGRTMDDVMDRIRSGLLGNTEAIEDLGVNVNVAMIQSTEAFKKFANGRSWQQLDFQTQNQIRLAAILEQTYKKYGNTVNQNTSSSMQQLVAQLKNLQLALGQAFLPIVNIVLPVLIAFVNGLALAMNAVSQFIQTLFGKTQQQVKATNNQAVAVSNLGDAYSDAGKAAKGALASFDEINSMSSNSGGGIGGISGIGLGGNGGGQINLGFDSSSLDILAEKAKHIAESMKKAFDSNLGPAFSELKQSILETIQSLNDLWAVMEPFLKPLGKLGFAVAMENMSQYIRVVVDTLKADFQIIGGAADILTGAMTGDTDKMKSGFQKVIGSVGDLARWVSFLQDPIGFTLNVAKDKIGSQLPAVFESVKNRIANVWASIKDTASNAWYGILAAIKVPLNAIVDVMNGLIRGMNKFHFELPDWLGGQSFGIYIPPIPHLANGGYVGANNPMMAVVGDNRNEGEIITPESKIYEQTLRAVQDALGNGNKEIVIMLNEHELGRASISAINRAQRISGRTLLSV